MYLGEINHRDKSYPGEHAPLIDRRLFEAVQTKLTENRQARRLRRQSSNALLMGKLFDDRGNPMTPSYAIKKGVRYRYYVSSVLNQGRKEEAGSLPRVAAEAVERLVIDAIAALPPAKQIETPPGSPSAELLSPCRDAEAVEYTEILAAAVDKITVGSRSIEIRLLGGADRPAKAIAIPWSPQNLPTQARGDPAVERIGQRRKADPGGDEKETPIRHRQGAAMAQRNDFWQARRH
jgi:hypothetical protein